MSKQAQKIAKASTFVAIVLLVLAMPWILRSTVKAAAYWTHVLILIGVFILMTSSMRAIFRTGELTLGTAGFMLLGGYGAAVLSIKAGLSPWLTMLLGALLAAAVGGLVAYPFFRVKGVYFAITTLLLGFVFLYLAGWMDWLTGGWQGLQFFNINPTLDFGSRSVEFTTKTNIEYYYLVFVVVGICLFVLYRMEHSRIGVVWNSIREADGLAQSVGINIMAHKIFVFVVACFFTGLAGGLYAFHVHALSPTSTPANVFHFFTSIYCLLYMVVGGTESFYGPLIGTTLLMLLREWGRSVSEYWPLILGALLILIVFFMPKGLVALPEYSRAWYRKSRGLFRRKAPSTE
ncbi:MAG: branched-chain amino acid ABC transporter permease [Thermoleophilia bacterium]|nr:branched-chain amino acid ABC transporter permease [Thermoleophilia bacterium]